MRRFCTSGPVDRKTCYYVERPELMKEALDHIENWRYFTVSAPRQSGKTTFLNDIVEKIKEKYLPIFISFESFGNIKIEEKFIKQFTKKIKNFFDFNMKIEFEPKKIAAISDLDEYIMDINEKFGKEVILMIDEFEILEEKLMNEFLHVIRDIYHSRQGYKLRSVILISVGYLSGVLEDNASPFNIAEHMEVPYFTKEQVYDLLNQHEKETGQVFEEKVKELIWHNAGGQPGLTNALAYDLVAKKAKGEKIITEKHFEKTLYDFMHQYIDKNISNIISKAEKEKELIMKILFEPESVEFNIYDERINYLYLNGVIDNCEGKCCVRVPLYYKALYDRFKPQVNGEKTYMATIKDTIKPYIREDGSLDLNKLLKRYIEYIKQRGAIMFKGRNYYEGVYQYNLDQFLSLYVEAIDGKVYPETEVGGGRIDLLINLNNKEYLIEVKVDITGNEYEKAKKQLIEYIKRKGLKEGWLIVYSNTIEDFEYITEEKDGVKIHVLFIKTNFESPSKIM
ncbi:AAA-like domain-containing protein [Marinitoga sp. 38H-ov]|uniref:AAA-like domain-containing protein n=1 Tax=Marinitoga sp. 38H-ov TaxID=1755814 RepID=UPI0013EA6442|nr:AAA-like domain-containing protein [Marinitoga sp. 38H-ov]KAF2956254.1 transcriptional regulator [Marinitoga sp. 38H-ov]